MATAHRRTKIQEPESGNKYMTEELKELHDSLGISFTTQNLLEKQIENQTDSLILKQQKELESKRLDKTKKQLQQINGKIGTLRRQLETAKISHKQKIRNSIAELETVKDELLRDIGDIQNRMQPDKKEVTETEQEFLVRTGQVTAFGNDVGFTVDPSVKQEDEYIPDGEETETEDALSDVSIGDKSDIKYEEEEIQEEEEGTKVLMDDGFEPMYKKRLNQWIEQRSSGRVGVTESEEYLLPHPNYPTASLHSGFKVPGEIYNQLFQYQRTCVQWLHELYTQRVGGIIGDEMGLGKTIQIISFIAGLHHSGLLTGPVLIVCPATVLRQWCGEFHKWWPPLRCVILHSIGSGMIKQKKRKRKEESDDEYDYEEEYEVTDSMLKLIDKVVADGHVMLTTYVGLRIHQKQLLPVKWHYVVLDEGHKIRNPDSDISLTCKQLKTHNRIILSGTPIQNNLTELWSLFDFIYPGRLGTLPVFQQQFAVPINMGGYANASNMQVQAGYKCAVVLRDLISPYLLRRVKSDVAKDLPKKNEMVLFCKLTQYQRDKYKAFLNSDDLQKIQNGKRQVLFGIDILRKICNHPDILDKSKNSLGYGDPCRSGKMQVVQSLLQSWRSQGHKTLLFTQSRQMLDILEKFVKSMDLKYLRMDGTTNIGHRQQLVDKFNNGDVEVFLLTTRVGGLGVNLTGANRIIIYDPDWNPSTDLQARERAWRIGQTREVTIYRLMISGAIEEKIYHRQIFKTFLTNKILKDPNQKRFFKMQELHDLFTLGGGPSQPLQDADDIENVKSMTGVSKLEGFKDAEEDKNEDEKLMDGLFGVENAIRHDEVVESHSRPSESLITKEADRIAQKAIEALKLSRKQTRKHEIGTVTWTGKFGVAGKKKKKLTSASLLANMKEKKQELPTDLNQEMVTKMQQFLLKQEGHFSPSATIVSSLGLSLKDREDLAKVRAMLKGIAIFDKSRSGWKLKDEFLD